MNATSEFRVLPGDNRTVFMADEEIPSGAPFRYFQIRMTDAGGNVHFSPIRQLSTGTGTTWTIYPNPVASGSSLTLVTEGAEILENIEWFHADGRMFSPAMVKGEGIVVFSTQGMPLGIYLVRARTSSGTTSSRIIISE